MSAALGEFDRLRRQVVAARIERLRHLGNGAALRHLVMLHDLPVGVRREFALSTLRRVFRSQAAEAGVELPPDWWRRDESGSIAVVLCGLLMVAAALMLALLIITNAFLIGDTL